MELLFGVIAYLDIKEKIYKTNPVGFKLTHASH